MTKKTPQPTKSTVEKRELSSGARWAQAGLALGLAAVLINWAIDTGSLLEYAFGLVFIGLTIRHIRQALVQRRKEKEANAG
jgi:hypothetical protein